MNDELVMPKVFFEKGVKNYDLHWDDSSAPVENVLHEQDEFLTGYITGCFDALYDGQAEAKCISGNTGTIKNLSLTNAKKLQQLIENVLHPLVIQSHKKLMRQNTVPLHMRSHINET